MSNPLKILPDSKLVIGLPVICPRDSSNNARFIGSQQSDIQKAPYQVALLINHWQKFQILVCGGAIIRPNVVITAAYCIHGTTSAKWRVRAGSANYNSGGQIANVKTYIEHSEFDKLIRVNDVALLFLSSPFSLGTNVKAINISMYTSDMTSSNNATATGWGSPQVDKCLTRNLRELTLKIIDIKNCSASYPDKFTSNNMICGKRLNSAKYLFENRRTICRGDIGGPLRENENNTLIGIISWGNGCANINNPIVFTNVMKYMDWINSNLSVN
ncbi:trypsin-like [Arctopsyche grandis]|uniref:trypsin-like n=1 Tax=Arctopsyche grandis TaxID=121162 RepID=UPI00406D65D0